jgi:hypothetical protein
MRFEILVIILKHFLFWQINIQLGNKTALVLEPREVLSILLLKWISGVSNRPNSRNLAVIVFLFSVLLTKLAITK